MASRFAQPNPAQKEVSHPSRVAAYKGYTVCDVTCQSGKGQWTACVAIMGWDATRKPSSRFLDFETFGSKQEAGARAEAGAVAWIDHQVRSEPPARPSGFAPLV